MAIAVAARASTGAARTAVELFNRRVGESAARCALRWKEGGAWREATWGDWDRASREIAGGLARLGVDVGDRVCIVANSRPEWMYADVGILMAGAATVPIYQSNLADECEYIVNDCGAKIVIAENPHQLEKLLSVKSKLGHVARVVLMDDRAVLEKPDARGRKEIALADVLGDGDAAWVTSLATLRSDGAKWIAEHAGALESRWEAIEPTSTFTIVYTSGTTGPPKGVVLTHRNITWTCDATSEILPYHGDDEQLLFLPLAHIFAKILEWGTIEKGAKIAFAESLTTIVPNLAEVRPSFMAAVPRVLEKVYIKVLSNRNAAPPLRQKIFDWAVGVGRKVSALQQQGKQPTGLLAIQHRLAEKLVFAKIKAVLGGNIKFLISGGAPLSREIAEFFHAVGILILEGYGLTETTAASFVNRLDRYRFGTVGPAVPGLECRIAEDGEVLLRAPSIMKEYYKRPDATAEVIDGEGYFHTGDIGVLEDGLLRITDRKKDIIVTAGGKNVAPQNLENALKATPYISQVMVVGDKRPYLVALVTLNEENVTKWAKDNNVAFTDLQDLAQKPEIAKLIGAAIEALNGKQPSYSSIKKFRVLGRDFAQETGELTPTLKVKRKFTSEKFKDVIDSLYAGA